MHQLVTVSEFLIRTVHALALGLSPRGPSPEPALPAEPAVSAFVAGLVIVCWILVPAYSARQLRSRGGWAAAGLLWAALGAAMFAAVHFSGAKAPLERGVLLVGAPLWAAILVVATQAAQHFNRGRYRYPRTSAAAAVLIVAALLYLRAGSQLTSTDAMWWAAMKADPESPGPLAALSGSAQKTHDSAAMLVLAGKCLEALPVPESGKLTTATCACLELRVRALLDQDRAAQALPDATAVGTRCLQRPAHRALYAQALAVAGQPEAAQREALAGLEEGGDLGELHYALAVTHARQNRWADALIEAGAAVDAGAWRNARLLAGMAGIMTGDLDAAEHWLAPLVQDNPLDTQAQYDLALVADKRGDYNRAREGYFAALRGDPRNAEARYNLALLAFRAKVVDEAQHHARKFLETFPGDPRGAQLAAVVGLPLPASAQGARPAMPPPGTPPPPGAPPPPAVPPPPGAPPPPAVPPPPGAPPAASGSPVAVPPRTP